MDSLKLILDQEIKTISEDKFGHKDYSNTLAQMINNLSGSYSIGLLGPWGVGKSTVKEMYCQSLKNDRKNEEIKTITFNAWKYGGDDLKRALIMHVVDTLSGGNAKEIEAFIEQLDNSVEVNEDEPKTTKDILKEVTIYIIQFFRLGLPILLFILAFTLLNHFFGELATGMSFIFSAVLGILIRSWNNDDNKISLFNERKVIKPPVTKSSQYEEILQVYLAKYLKGNHKKYKKIVIFVDDLDRLSPSEMVGGIDAIRVFLEMSFDKKIVGEKFEGFVFVVSCDEEKVAKAILPRTRVYDGEADLPGSLNNIQDAKDFLDRIFQFRLEIASIPKDDLRTYVHGLMEVNENAVEAISKSGESMRSVIYRLIHTDVNNPRNAKQLINAFLQSLWIAQKREKRNNEMIGSIEDGYITNKLEILAMFSAIRINYSFFYQLLIIEPRLMHSFYDKFVHSNQIKIRENEYNELSDNERELLKQMTHYKDEGYTLTKKFLPLRNYLSANKDIVLPDNIRPFILLNQEQIEKEVGNYTTLLNALKSADSYTTLRELGEPVDIQLLRNSSIAAISSLLESTFITSATEIEKANASDVISNLLKRLEVRGDHSKLTSFLAFNYSTNQTCRVVVQVENLLSNIEVFDKVDLKRIGQTLMVDYIGEEPKFRVRNADSNPERLNKRFNFVISKFFDIAHAIETGSYSEMFKTQLYKLVTLIPKSSSYASITVDGEMLVREGEVLWDTSFIYDLVELLKNRITTKRLGISKPLSDKLLLIIDKPEKPRKDIEGLIKITPVVYSSQIKRLLSPIHNFVVSNLSEYSTTELRTLTDICIEKIHSHYETADDKSLATKAMASKEYLYTLKTVIKDKEIGNDGFIELVVNNEISKREFVEDELVDIISFLIPKHKKALNDNILKDWPTAIYSFNAKATSAVRTCIYGNLDSLDESILKLITDNMIAYPRNNVYFNDQRRVDFAWDWFNSVPNHMLDISSVSQVFAEFMTYMNPTAHTNYSNTMPNVNKYIEVAIKLFASRDELLSYGLIQSRLMTALSTLRTHSPQMYITLFKEFDGKWKPVASDSGKYTPTTLMTEAQTGARSVSSEIDRTRFIESALSIKGIDSTSEQKRGELLEVLLPMLNSHLEKVHHVVLNAKPVPALDQSKLVDTLSAVNFAEISDKEKLIEILNAITNSYNQSEEIAFIQNAKIKLKEDFVEFIVDEIALIGSTLVALLKKSNEQECSESVMILALNRAIANLDDDKYDFEIKELITCIPDAVKYAAELEYIDFLTKVTNFFSSRPIKDSDVPEETRLNVLQVLKSSNNKLVIGNLLDFVESTGLEKYEGLSGFESYYESFGANVTRMYKKKFRDTRSNRDDVY